MSAVSTNGLTILDDCRRHFRPLTELTPNDTPSPCTIVVKPGAGWEQPLLRLLEANSALDAEICFPVGTFPVSSPVVITSSGNIKVSGAGWGTKLVGSGVEALLQFNGCASAVVRDLSGTAPTVRGSPYGAAGETRAIHGALDFNNCGEVLVENVSLTCGSALVTGAACLVVRSDVTQNLTTGFGNARIRGSRFAAGEMQYGILLVHQARASVEHNLITVDQSSYVPWSIKIENTQFQEGLMRMLLRNAVVSTPRTSSVGRAKPDVQRDAAPSEQTEAPPIKIVRPTSGTITVGKTTLKFDAPGPIAATLQTYLERNGPKEFATAADLYTATRSALMEMIAKPSVLQQYPSAADFLRKIERADGAVGARGIAVGGRAITELRIRDNSIDHMQQGITVGVSDKQQRKPQLPADSLTHVSISDNVINAVLSSARALTMARWGIFVGNAASISIQRNDVSLTADVPVVPASDGIRVWGYLGPKLIISENSIGGFTRDIFVRALLPTGPTPGTVYWYTDPPTDPKKTGGDNRNLWIVLENYVAGNTIIAPACDVGANWPGPIVTS